MPWASMSYKHGDHTYHVQHMNHADNPDSTIWSAYRDYGRFGAFFKHRLGDGESLTLKYRIHITVGDEAPSREAMQGRYAAWTSAE
jgi:hypothetical protein